MNRLAVLVIFAAVVAVVAVLGFQEVIAAHHKDMQDIERMEKINRK